MAKDTIVAAQPTAPVPGQGNRIGTSGTLPAGSNNRGSYSWTNTLAAAGSVNSIFTVPLGGTKFYVYEADGPVVIQPSNANAIQYDQGTGENLGNESPFASLTVSNPGASAITVTLIISYDDFIDNRVIIDANTSSILAQNAPTVNVGSGDITLGSFGEQTFPGTANGATKRKTFIICNTHATIALILFDKNDVNFAYIPPGTSFAMDSSDQISVLSNSATVGATAIVGEIYYADV